MHQSYVIVLGLLAGSIGALPLNINLGAYSPALVVGDGEISFGGKQDVSNLMNALEGAAVAGGAANGAGAETAKAAPAAGPAAALPAAQPAAEATTIQAVPADSSAQITALQGMGKEIAPRVVMTSGKRDLNSFNAALNFASAALKTSPEIQLGTGEGGSGVGITQKAGGTTTGAKAAIVGRDEVASPKMKTTVTTMFVRGGVAQPAGMSTSSFDGGSETISTWANILVHSTQRERFIVIREARARPCASTRWR